MTSLRFIAHPLVLRRLEVIRVSTVTPRMRRITLGGTQLSAFERAGIAHPAFASPMFDDHVKLLFNTDGPVEDVLPAQLAHGIEWTPSNTRAGRDYTPRRVAENELDLDFVMHALDGEPGPAESWARTASVGDELWVVGPKSSTVLPTHVDRVVLIGDETALPAISRFLEERPVNAPVRALITIADDEARQELACGPDDEIRWVRAAPEDASVLERAVEEWGPVWFMGRPYVWAGAESRALLPVRRSLSRVHGIPKSHQNITGYWHARVADAADADATDAAVAPSGPTAVASPAAWFAVRAALQLGVFDALEECPTTATELHRRLDLPDSALEPLLAVLTARGLLHPNDQTLRLTARGHEIVTDDHERERFEGFTADALLALRHFAGAARNGGSAWQLDRGVSLAALETADVKVRNELEEQAAGLAYLMPAFVTARPWGNAPSVSVHGPGRSIVTDALSSLADPPPVDADGVTTQIHARALTHRTDDEARAYLSALTAAEVILIEPTRADPLDPHSVENELLQTAITGAAPRSIDRLTHLSSEAGWRVAALHELGWGVTALTLRYPPHPALA